ncbi:hypothetical protein Tsubulata_006905 [Turnera subulata]|uniref:DEUBAD domain-containing protein n=1 Tax=Turnera subulata TaxID=218843 RepID=A0A9Q0GG24_9ROSI|nr:hypothetical protein Tsubulata_006905 [Turnera subulata]
MGIQKICLRNSSCHKISNSSNTRGKEVGDNPALAADSEDDSDDGELTGSGCELGLVGGQLCCIPYELYDLPDLRGILSLETWDSCLTEEERVYLSAYLPDMDQQTFCLTMKELFNGSNLFFGNPLDMFFKRLRGGFYPPKVAFFREGLLCLQRRKYYHSLRCYHDRMVQKFKEMRRMGEKGELNPSLQERICMWSKKGKQRGINLLDLNKSPNDDNILSEEANLDAEGMNSLERKDGPKDISLALATYGMKFASPNCRPKGVLKMKAPGNSSFQDHNQKLGASGNTEPGRSVPKGVLKIVPKGTLNAIPRGAEPNSLVHNQGVEEFRYSSFIPSIPFQDTGNLRGLPFQKVDCYRVNSTQSQCMQNQPNTVIGIDNLSERYTRGINNGMLPSVDDISLLEKHKLFTKGMQNITGRECQSLQDPVGSREHKLGSGNFWPSTAMGSKDLSLKFLESFPFDVQYRGGEQQLALGKQEYNTCYPRYPEAASRISDAGNSKAEMMMESFSKQYENDDSSKQPENLSGKSSGSDGGRVEPVLPLTYKRRKALAKINLFELGKPLTAGADLKSVIPKDSD